MVEHVEEIKKALGSLSQLSLTSEKSFEGVEGEDLVKVFLETVEMIPPEKEEVLPREVVILYNTVSVEFTKAQEAKARDKCPAFGTGWDPDVQDCRDCKGAFPKEYEECLETCGGVESDKTQTEETEKETKKKTGQFTRVDAFCIAIQKGGTLDEIASEVDRMYTEKGKKSSIKEAKNTAKYGLSFLGGSGVLNEIEGVYTLKEVKNG